MSMAMEIESNQGGPAFPRLEEGGNSGSVPLSDDQIRSMYGEADIKFDDLTAAGRKLASAVLWQGGSCCSCFATTAKSGQPICMVALPCDHSYCLGCLRNVFTTALGDIQLFPVRCCKLPLDVRLALLCLAEPVYRTFIQRHFELSLDAADRMACPNKRCGSVIDLSGLDQSSRFTGAPFLCPDCQTRVCFKCRGPWDPHSDVMRSCEAILQQREAEEQKKSRRSEAEEKEFQELVFTKKWQRCPKCSRVVELTVGCNHMTCVCRTEFCYECRAIWK